jgi:RelE toxin of RelE / RelB toxin-antitoxin system
MSIALIAMNLSVAIAPFLLSRKQNSLKMWCTWQRQLCALEVTVSTPIATNRGNRWIFVYGFSKNEHNNLGKDEAEALKNWHSLHLRSKAWKACCEDSGCEEKVAHRFVEGLPQTMNLSH